MGTGGDGQGRARRATVLVAGMLLLAACTDVQAPPRAERYEWRLPATLDSAGLRPIDVSFHWPRTALPVRIWVQDAAGMPGHVATAIEDWRDAFLYGEFDGRVVEDSGTADVIVRVASPGAAALRGARLGSALAPECEGETILPLVVAPNVRTLQLPVRVYLYQKLDTPALDACYRLTARHELGHALGIWRHAPDPADVMFANPVADSLSDADRQTIEYLYHFPTEITLTR